MPIITTNGMTMDVALTGVPPNGPDLLQKLGDQVDAFYGSIVANVGALPGVGKFPGQRVWVTDIETHAVWNPTANMWDGYWKSVAPTLSGLAGTVAARWLRVGKKVTVEFTITATGAGSGSIILDKPTLAADTSGVRAVGFAMGLDSGASGTRRSMTVCNESAARVFFIVDSLSAAATVATNVPWTWGSGDTIGGVFEYEEAA